MSVDLSPTIAGLGLAGVASSATLVAKGSPAKALAVAAAALPTGAIVWGAVQPRLSTPGPVATMVAGSLGLATASGAVSAAQRAGLSAARTGAIGVLVGTSATLVSLGIAQAMSGGSAAGGTA